MLIASLNLSGHVSKTILKTPLINDLHVSREKNSIKYLHVSFIIFFIFNKGIFIAQTDHLLVEKKDLILEFLKKFNVHSKKFKIPDER